jgi:hypothetical protein
VMRSHSDTARRREVMARRVPKLRRNEETATSSS